LVQAIFTNSASDSGIALRNSERPNAQLSFSPAGCDLKRGQLQLCR
jgi:hypothetical protein